MLILFLILWCFIYIYSFFKCLFEFRQLYTCIKRLFNFITSYKERSRRYPQTDVEYKSDLTKLLRYYPVIHKYKKYPALSYSISDDKNYENSKDLINELIMIRNFKRRELLNALHPLTSLKLLAKFPTIILGWIGIEPQKRVEVLINALAWVIVFLSGLFSEEIKTLISSLFK